MTVVKPSEPKIVIDGFSGGVNTKADPTHLSPGELALVRNMVCRDGRTLETRGGQTIAQKYPPSPSLRGPCNNLLRYRSLSGDKRRLIVSGDELGGNYLYYDGTPDDGIFTKSVKLPGTPDLEQYYDAVLYASDQQSLSAFNPNEYPATLDTTVNAPMVWQNNLDPIAGQVPLEATATSVGNVPKSGGGLLSKAYVYYMTYDFAIGDVFLGETGPINIWDGTPWRYTVDFSAYPHWYCKGAFVYAGGSSFANPPYVDPPNPVASCTRPYVRIDDGDSKIRPVWLKVTNADSGRITEVDIEEPGLFTDDPGGLFSQYSQVYKYDHTTTTTGSASQFTLSFAERSDHYVEFTKALAGVLSPWISAVNFYRSEPLDSLGSVSDTEPYWSSYWVGSVDADTYNNAAVDDVIFTDYGLITPGKQLRKYPMKYTPRSKHVEKHKGRIWLSSPSMNYNDENPSLAESWTYEPDLVAFSAFESNGTEPFVYFDENTVAVGAGEPDEITGMRSWRNQVLLIWKANKMYAILGGDDEISLGIPNIQVQLIDPNVGCIAPKTICEVDGGIAWLSNRGPYIFDGTAPRPLKSLNVQAAFDAIPPASRKNAVGVYNSRDREYIIYHASSFDGGTTPYNRDAMRFSFVTGSWMLDRYEFGIGAAVDVRDEDNQSYVLQGRADDKTRMFSAGGGVILVRADSGPLEYFVSRSVAAGADEIDFKVDLGFLDAGAPFLDKKFKELVIEATSYVPMSLDVVIDNKYDSRTTGETIDISPPVDDETLVWGQGKWQETKWGAPTQGYRSVVLTRNLDTLPVGKSIRPIISGSNLYEPVKIHSITIFFEPKAGTR